MTDEDGFRRTVTTNDREPAILQAFWFVVARWRLVVPISLLILLPIFWHQRIEAGDLASHTYNAWLVQLIEGGQAPGLYIVRQWNNILVDVALLRLGSILGLPAAEKIVASVCALSFFWGTFAFISTATRRPPWFLIPAVAMITYGWTFQMGFMNYYLSLGLGFLAIAVLWRKAGAADWIVGSILLALTWMAHPMGLGCVIGILVYVILADKLSGWYRWALLASACGAAVALHFYIVHHFRTQYWETSVFYLMNGADQLVLYGARYAKLAMTALLFGSVAFLYDRRRQKEDGVSLARLRTAFELWAILLLTAAMLPELIQLPQYAGPVGFPVSRLTSITAVMGLSILGFARPRRWHLAGFALLATLFFTWMFQDTRVLNRMEAQAEKLVSTLPYGQRVTGTIWAPRDSRIFFVNHLLDRACIGRCFAYSNYEPPSGQFRIRVRPGSPLVTSSWEDSYAMQQGEYAVRPEDMPMSQIYQCDARDLTRLCIRDLAAGDKNGSVGYHPPATQ
jgi:hypothetical protein